MMVVTLKGLEFYAYHGVPDEEQVVGHRYVVDLRLDLDDAASYSDQLCDTVDYGSLSTQLAHLAQKEQHRTIERLARRLAEATLDEHPLVQRVHVNLRKRLPPAPVIVEEAGVELTVGRS